MKDFYKTISPEELKKYADKIGLGGEYPTDLKEIVNILQKNKKHRILEVGCGTGRIGIHLISLFDYVGIDFNKTYLNHFKDSLKSKGIPFSEEQLLNTSFFDYKEKDFDAILFPWSVIVDFSKNDQDRVLIKSKNMLSDNGIIILDHPQKGQVFNSAPGYYPTPFFFEDHKDDFLKWGFSRVEQVLYTTLIGRKQEITILYKTREIINNLA